MSCITTSWEFYPGETKTLDIQLVTYNKATDCKDIFPISEEAGKKISLLIPALPADLTFSLTTTPAVQVIDVKLGKLRINLRPEDTNKMVSGTILVNHDADGAGTNIKIALAKSVIRKLVLPSC